MVYTQSFRSVPLPVVVASVCHRRRCSFVVEKTCYYFQCLLVCCSCRRQLFSSSSLSSWCRCNVEPVCFYCVCTTISHRACDNNDVQTVSASRSCLPGVFFELVMLCKRRCKVCLLCICTITNPRPAGLALTALCTLCVLTHDKGRETSNKHLGSIWKKYGYVFFSPSIIVHFYLYIFLRISRTYHVEIVFLACC